MTVPAVFVRELTTDDVPLLIAFYEDASETSRRTRFFTERFDTADVERQAHYHMAHGRVLGCFSSGDGRLLGEARWLKTESGSAEFALAVGEDERRRGVGTGLMESLLASARQAGIGVLTGSVLLTNTPMRELLGRFGYVVTGREGPAVARVAVGTDGKLPPWPANRTGPRLLIESDQAWWRNWHAELGVTSGSVYACPGPREVSASWTCPLLSSGSCPLVADADDIRCAFREVALDKRLRAAHAHRSQLSAHSGNVVIRGLSES